MTDSDLYKVIQLYFHDKPVKKVQLFGSVARNEMKESSDIDLIITMEHPVGLIKLAGYKLELEFLLKKTVDLATEPGISPEFRTLIHKDLMTVYERK